MSTKPLTGPQKSALARMAKDAFVFQTAKGQTAGFTADSFRQLAVYTATQGAARGLSEATDDQFRRIRTHLTTLLEGDEFTAAISEGTEGRERALFRIDETAKKGGFGPAYLATVVRNRWGVGDTWRDDLTEAQLADLSKTLTRNLAFRKNKATAGR